MMSGRTMEPIPVPAPTLKPNEKVVPYTPMVYQGPAPAALPPSTDPLPWERRQLEAQKQQEEYARKKAEIAKKEQEAKGKGWFSNLSVGLSSALNEVSAGVSKVGSSLGGSAHQTVTEQLEKDFRASFGLPGTERLWDAYSCRCVNGPAACDGWLYISTNYASFFSRNGEQVVAFIMPLRNIVSIQKANATKTPNAAIAPQLTIAVGGGPHPSTPGAVLPDAFQIFTLDGTIHSFFYFWSFMDCYNVLDRAWRQCFQAPQVVPLAMQHGYGQPAPQQYPAAPGM